jgi:hypothetical protein
MQQELTGDTDLAALDAELAGFNAEEQARAQRAVRARQLEQALGTVRDATENVERLTEQLQKYDSALAALRRVRKAVEGIPEQTIGGGPSLNMYSTKVGTEILDDVGDHLHQILNATVPLVQDRRDRTAESIRKTQERLDAAEGRSTQAEVVHDHN